MLQGEVYVALARLTEIVSCSNWKKAHIELDRTLSDLLEKNNIDLDYAIEAIRLKYKFLPTMKRS